MAIALRRILGLARRRWLGGDDDRIVALEARMTEAEQARAQIVDLRAQIVDLSAQIVDLRAQLDALVKDHAARLAAAEHKLAAEEQLRGMADARLVHLERLLGLAAGKQANSTELIERLLEVRLGQVESRFATVVEKRVGESLARHGASAS